MMNARKIIAHTPLPIVASIAACISRLPPGMYQNAEEAAPKMNAMTIRKRMGKA